MKLLIVGGGSVGKRHLRNFRSLGVESFGVVDPRVDRRAELAPEPGVIATFETLEASLGGGFSAAIVCAPTAFHVPIGTACLEAGMHVLMEKPLSHTMDGVDEMLETARARGLTFMVGYTYRFWPPLQRLKTLLDEQRIGQLLFMHVAFSQYLPDWHPWEDYRTWFMSKREQGGGALLDESHTLDMVRWLVGEIDDLWCETGNLSKLEMTADDYAQFVVRFANGVRGTVHMDVFSRQPFRSLEFSGEEGNIRCDLNANEITVHVPGSDPVVERFTCDRNEMFVAEARCFLEAMAGRTPAVVSGDDARRTLRIIIAGLESDRSGCRVRV